MTARPRATELVEDRLAPRGNGRGVPDDTVLPKVPASVHLLLRDKASWVEPQIGANDDCFDGYPELSIEDWHKKHGLWVK